MFQKMKVGLLLVVIVILAIVAFVLPTMGAATLQDVSSAGFSQTKFVSRVYTGTFVGGSDTFTIASTFDVDMMDGFYTELHDNTLVIEMLSNTSGAVKITGDDTYDYLVVVKDYEDY